MQIGRTTSEFRQEKYLLWVGLSLPLLLLVFLFFRQSNQASTSGKDEIYCNAEFTKADQFIQQDHFFSGANYQSSEQARSGRHSARLPGNGETHRVFLYELKDPQAGAFYKVSVWQLRDTRASVSLIVQARDAEKLYKQSSQAILREGKWDKMEVHFFVPFGQNQMSDISIYVQYQGPVPVYVDDFLIEQSDQWEKTAMQPARIELDISPAGLRKLEQKRKAALRAGVLQTGADDWVDARFRIAADTVLAAKVRLKGDWLDHLSDDKWSFRVQLKSPGTWRGMTVFSLHTPVARHYLHEWILHRLWQEEDVLSPRYDFVELVVNGSSKGIYAYEEHFAKELVESQRRREGPILRLSEAGYWSTQAKQLQHQGYQVPGAPYPGLQLDHAPIEVFDEADWMADTTLAPLVRQAKRLLAAYRQKTLAPEQVFDLNTLARYYAICDVLRAYHGIAWHNQRFYYNPITARLEPVGFDGFGSAPARHYSVFGAYAEGEFGRRSGSIYAPLLQSRVFMKYYSAHLQRISSRHYLADFMDAHQAEWLIRLSWIQAEFPKYRFKLNDFLAEASYVQSLLYPVPESAFRLYHQPDGRYLIQNQHSLPLELIGYGYATDRMDHRFDTALWLWPRTRRSLVDDVKRNKQIHHFGDYRYQDAKARMDFMVPQPDTISLSQKTRYLFYRLPGVDSVCTAEVQVYPDPYAVTLAEGPTHLSDPADFASLQKQGDRWELPTGTHLIDRDLIIGPDDHLWIEAGVRLELRKGASIISYGAVYANGTEENPILIRADGGMSSFNVIQASAKSQLRYTRFEAMRHLQKGDWRLPGAVSFYESDVDIEHCSFVDNVSEDGLNIVRSRFSLKACHFSNTTSDAFDSDFSEGVIENCHFVNTTNDGVDCSGSVILIKNSLFSQCGDKAISVGEESDVILESSQISTSNIAMAAKDYSTLLVRSVALRDCAIGFAIYQKKAAYGPAQIFVEDYESQNVDRLYRVAEGNRLQLKEELISP